MKKTKIAVLLIFACVCRSFAWNASKVDETKKRYFEKKHHYVSAGYGFPNLYKVILQSQLRKQFTRYIMFSQGSKKVSYNTSGSGPFFAKYEYSLSRIIGIGLTAGYFRTTSGVNYNYEESVYVNGVLTTREYLMKQEVEFNSFSIACRTNAHLINNENFDFFVGAAIGYTYLDIKYSLTDTNPNGFSFSYRPSNPFPLHLAFSFGGRYSLNSSVALYAEVGIEKWSFVQCGLTFRI